MQETLNVSNARPAPGHAVLLERQTDRQGGREGRGNTQRSKSDVQIWEGIRVLRVRAAWLSHIQHNDSAGIDGGTDERIDEGEIDVGFPLITGVKTGLRRAL